jgi:hypothetical protein
MENKIKTMEHFSHAVEAEESISNYIALIEKDSSATMPDEDKDWLYKRGQALFNLYYVSKRLDITVATPEDNKILTDYVDLLQTNMSKMYAHIIVSEFKLYLLEKKLRGE